MLQSCISISAARAKASPTSALCIDELDRVVTELESLARAWPSHFDRGESLLGRINLST